MVEVLYGWQIYRANYKGDTYWCANRHGVSMNAHSRTAIRSMVRDKHRRQQQPPSWSSR